MLFGNEADGIGRQRPRLQQAGDAMRQELDWRFIETPYKLQLEHAQPQCIGDH